MATIHEIEVWVRINESGEYEVAPDQDVCNERFAENCSEGEAARFICLKLKVPAPAVLTLTGEVPAEKDGEIALAVE